MHPEWPLILFTFFLCVAGGALGAQGLLNVMGKGKKMQLASLVTALAALVVGGLSVLSTIVVVLQVIAPGVIPQALSGIVSFLSMIAGLVVLVVAFIPGKVGPNVYGPDPKPAPTYEGYGQI